MRRAACFALALFATSFCIACSDNPSDDDDGPSTGGAGGAGTGGAGTGGAQVCESTEVLCSDQVLQTMNLKPDPAPGLISSAPDGTGWLSTIDATAGGAFAEDPHSFVYGRFADAGLEKVDISDEASLESLDWDIAFRRYVVRINSGHSGPSCVVAARVPGTGGYDALTAAPEGLNYRTDEYFTASCEIIPDGSGLENSPATALSSYWTYPGCVKMTDNVFVVKTRDGRLVKLTVVNYYEAAAQEQCDTTDMVAMGDNGAATFGVRWAFLP